MERQILALNGNKKYKEILKIAKELTPDSCENSDVWYAVGKAYEEEGMYQKAIPWFLKCYQLSGADEELGMVLGVALAAKEYDTTEKILESVDEFERGFYYWAAKYELLRKNNQDMQEQIEALEQLLDMQDDDNYLLRLAMLYLKTEREKDAKKVCKRIERLFLNGESVDYAKELAKAIKDGSALSYINEKPWVKGNVFKHLTFQEISGPKIVKQVEIKEPESKVSSVVESCFEDVVGMEELKVALDDVYALLQLEKKRKRIGFNRRVIGNNIIIAGPDGCGKTTAAIVATKVLNKIGIVSAEEPVETDYANILGATPEETFDNIKAVFENAEDGVVLIDNIHEFDDEGAYALGLNAIDQIVKAYHAAQNKVALIITGNEEKIQKLLEKKKKLADIFQLEPIVLGHYTADELVAISHHIAEEKNFILDEEADLMLREKMDNMTLQADFRYSRDLERMLNNAFINAAKRLSHKRRISEADALLIMPEDFHFEESDESVEELLAQLDRLTGLEDVKKQVHQIVNSVKMQKKAMEMGISIPGGHGTLHLVFKGNAGTGKTTVARIIGKIYKRLGVLTSGQLIEVTRRDLVSEYVGKTAVQVQAKVKEAMGGILFIDEAYTLCKDDADSFGKEAVDALVADIENHRDSMMVILAGYSRDMEKFLDKNQGLRSRLSTEIIFQDYSAEEMLQIFKKNIKDRGLVLDVGLENDVRALISRKSRQKDFGNARGVRNVLEKILLNQKTRLSQYDADTLSRNDFLIIRKEDLGGKEEECGNKVQYYLDELNALTGLASVKQKVNMIVDTVQVNKKMEELGLPSQGFGTLHMVFKGNAGTGKTTVARLLGNIYKELGVLTTGNMIECGRSDLVAGYAGQTSAKVKEKVQEALGGILFIDEAYSLSHGSGDTYGQEAIDTLVADMENYRKDLMVVIAGYSDDMDGFLAKNQGLSSRFSNEILFEDYTVEEMFDIFKGMVSAKNLSITKDAEVLVMDLICEKSTAKNFGNARGVRNLLDKIVEQRNVRIAQLIRAGVDITKEEALLITADDMKKDICL